MTDLRIALETKLLAYAEDCGDTSRWRIARNLVARLPAETVVAPVQVLTEHYRVLTGKLKWTATKAKAAVQSWGDAFQVADSTWSGMQAALELATDHRLQIWDAFIMSVAALSMRLRPSAYEVC